MLFNLERYSLVVLMKQVKALCALAWPIMLAQVAVVGMGVVDTMMSERAGQADLAAVALGNSMFTTVMVTCIGIMTALNPMIAQLHGAGKKKEIGEMGRQGLWFALLLGCIGMLLLIMIIHPLKQYLNLNNDIKSKVGDYLFYVSFGLPAVMLHRALHAYTSSLNRPKPAMWVSWIGLFLNIPLNYMFIYGKWGAPILGGVGCGVATASVMWFSFFALGVYTLIQRDFHPYGLGDKLSLPDRHALAQFWKLGWSIGFSYFLEVSLFTSIAWLINRLGADTIAAQQIIGSISSVVYMMPASLGAATTVCVGYALGQRDFMKARYISGVALLLSMSLALLVSLILFFGRAFWVGLYTHNQWVLHMAMQLLIFSACIQIFDFLQSVASYALRGYKITRLPMIIHAMVFWGIGLLPGYYFAYGLGMGLYGFWLALGISVVMAALILVWYLEKCSARIME